MPRDGSHRICKQHPIFCRSELASRALHCCVEGLARQARSYIQSPVVSAARPLKTPAQGVFNGQPDLIGIQFGLGRIAPMHVMAQ